MSFYKTCKEPFSAPGTLSTFGACHHFFFHFCHSCSLEVVVIEIALPDVAADLSNDLGSFHASMVWGWRKLIDASDAWSSLWETELHLAVQSP